MYMIAHVSTGCCQPDGSSDLSAVPETEAEALPEAPEDGVETIGLIEDAPEVETVGHIEDDTAPPEDEGEGDNETGIHMQLLQ